MHAITLIMFVILSCTRYRFILFFFGMVIRMVVDQRVKIKRVSVAAICQRAAQLVILIVGTTLTTAQIILPSEEKEAWFAGIDGKDLVGFRAQGRDLPQPAGRVVRCRESMRACFHGALPRALCVLLNPRRNHGAHLLAPFAAIEDAVMPDLRGHMVFLFALGQVFRDLERRFRLPKA